MATKQKTKEEKIVYAERRNQRIKLPSIERILMQQTLPEIPLQPAMIVGILGDPGAGKTTLLTSIAVDEYRINQRPIVANYDLYHVPYTYMHLEDIAHHAAEIRDCNVYVTEISEEADAYEFFKKNAVALSEMVSQLRKQQCRLFYDDQRSFKVAKRIRSLTNNLIMLQSYLMQGVAQYQVTDSDKVPIQGLSGVLDLRPYFPFFNTYQRITKKEKGDKSTLQTIENDDDYDDND